jgi:hypothetical protein
MIRVRQLLFRIVDVCHVGVSILVSNQCCSTQDDSIHVLTTYPIFIAEQIAVPVTEVAYTSSSKQTAIVVASIDLRTTESTVDWKRHTTMLY